MSIFFLVILFQLVSNAISEDDGLLRRQLRKRANLDDRSLSSSGGISNKIVGGEDVESPATYPFMGRMLRGCGASVIHQDIILTAGHCAREGGSNVVFIGPNNRTTTDFQYHYTIEEEVEHPLYVYDSGEYDFAVMKLDRSVARITPVPLNRDPTHPSETFQGLLTAIGFGKTAEKGNKYPDMLQEVDLEYIPYELCSKWYSEDYLVEDCMFCAGYEKGQKDTCNGDSGGPLLDANGTQVGVTSWGFGCARKKNPGVYARVSSAVDWIDEQICLLSDYPPLRCQPYAPLVYMEIGCGASLISPNTILTSAHCAQQATKNNTVYIGGTERGTGIVRSVVDGSLHPEFNNLSRWYDIAVLQLNASVDSWLIPPIELSYNPDDVIQGDNLTIWNFDGLYDTITLTEGDFEVLSFEGCLQDLHVLIRYDLLFCARQILPLEVSCRSLPGAPILNTNGTQVGIVSFGKGNGCGRHSVEPVVSSRVNTAVGFIEHYNCFYDPDCEFSIPSSPPSLLPSSLPSNQPTIPTLTPTSNPTITKAPVERISLAIP